MNVRFTISSLQTVRNKHLIARRIARIPDITMTQALLFLEHLPAVIFHSLNYNEAKELEKDLIKFGCTSRIEPLISPATAPAGNESEEKTEKKEEPVAVKEIKFDPIPSPAFIYHPQKEKPESPSSSWRWKKSFFKMSKPIIFLLFCVLATAGAAGLFLFLQSRQNPGSADFKEQTQKEIQTAISEMEKKLQKDSLNPVALEKTADLYKKMAIRLGAPSGKLQYLTRALRLKSDDPQIRALLAKTYVDTARTVFRGEAEIRFYQMAISFNPYNEAAWDGLIGAYEKNGQAKEAEQTQAKKDKIFGENISRLLDEVKTFGEVIAPPETTANRLAFGYAAKISGKEALLKETHKICLQLKKKQNKDSITILVFTPEGNEFSVSSLLKSCPEKYDDWKAQIKVNQKDE
jgi:tetratricopeptide (TPR) repeat protein